MWKAIASPSRSGSGARNTLSTAPAAARISWMTLALLRMTTYSGWKFFLGSTPIRDLGRSLMCPTDAFTTKALPRYFLMVRAFAGDSTTRSDLPEARTGASFLGFAGLAAFAAVFFAAGFAADFASDFFGVGRAVSFLAFAMR